MVRARKAVIGLAAGIGLTVGASSAAYALWAVARPLPSVMLSTSTFGVTANWEPAPDLNGMFPGDTRNGVGKVTVNTSAKWDYTVTTNVEGGLAGALTATWYPNAGCTGQPVQGAALRSRTFDGAAGDTATWFCVKYTLSKTAPSASQGKTAEVSAHIDVKQVQ